jgi:hypothetical protein
MKKHLLLIAFVFTSLVSQATHQMVYELFYDHVPNSDKYILTLVSGAYGFTNAPLQLEIFSNSPFDTIILQQVYFSTIVDTPCANPIKLLIFKSDTLDLGPIPTAGYRFGLTDCCRNNINSFVTPFSRGFYVEAHMLPEPGFTYASSSPRIINPAMEQQLPGIFSLHQLAMDPDDDSIYYSLVDAREGPFSNPQNIPYQAGYSGFAPVGINNPITINQQTGTFSSTNPVQGRFVFNIRVQTFKNSVLTSTIHRDLTVTLFTPSPLRPTISLSNYAGANPIQQGSVGFYSTLVYTGDSIQFDVNGSVFLDTIFLIGTSRLLSLSNNTAGNCTGTCASFMPNPNLYGLANANGTFKFVADTNHLNSANSATYEVAFTAASQNKCKPYLFDNLIVRVTVANNPIGQEETLTTSVNTYPNPSSGIFNVENPIQHSAVLEVFSMHGQRVYTQKLDPGTQTINLSHLPKGNYILLIDGQNPSKIIIE